MNWLGVGAVVLLGVLATVSFVVVRRKRVRTRRVALGWWLFAAQGVFLCALLGGNGDDVDPVAGEGTGPSPAIAVGILVVGAGGSVVHSWLHRPGQVPRIETVQSSAGGR